MRIVSLLPSLTELVCALGRGAELVGVTHECDYPPGVERLPQLTCSRIPTSASSAQIDALVQDQGGSLYDLDAALLEQLAPDLILTQAQCDVCAVNERAVRQVAQGLACAAHVESVNPTSLAGVFAMFRRVGELLDRQAEAESLIASFEATSAEIAQRISGRPRPRVALLEWLDPPFSCGHWNPDLIALAGGEEVLGKPRQPSRRLTWQDVTDADPAVLLLAPCGFTLERTEQDVPRLLERPEWRALRAVRNGRIVPVDGSAYFSRPGPRLEQSLRIAAEAIHPEVCGNLGAAVRARH